MPDSVDPMVNFINNIKYDFFIDLSTGRMMRC